MFYFTVLEESFCFVSLFYSRKATKVTNAHITYDCFVTQRSASATCATFRDIFEGCAGGSRRKFTAPAAGFCG